MIQNDAVRVRMAPSPTGFMHIGTLRTLLYDALFAHQQGGALILRIEDTDQSRKVDGAVEDLLERLRWVGITPDEGPYLTDDGALTERGSYGPYTQSQRLDIYKEHVAILLKKGHAYHCFCSPERLDTMRSAQQKAKKPPMYDRQCCMLTEKEIVSRLAQNESHVIRMKVPRGEEVVVKDLVRGDVHFKTDTLDDQVIMKSDGFPTYHLAVVVDDHLMKISHVIRGEEWLPSTPKHILLYQMFAWDTPVFAHLPLLLNFDKSKLSKRQGDVSVEDYSKKGYLKEAIINFVALLGWNPGGGSTKEIFTYNALLDIFDIRKVHKSGAVVDISKLNWLNTQYIKKMNIDALFVLARPFFAVNVPDITDEIILKKVLTVEQDRLERLDHVGMENPFFFERRNVDKKMLRWKENNDNDTKEMLIRAMDTLNDVSLDMWSRENLQDILMKVAGEKRGDFLWPLRAALTGAKRSPSPMDCVWVLGKEETLRRLGAALDHF